MEPWRKRDIDAADRIRRELAKPLPPSQEEAAFGEYFDPWEVFDGITGSYSGGIDEAAIHALEAIRDKKTFDAVNGQDGLFVEFFLHIVAGHGYVEYGTSPRGAWFTHDAVDVLADEWIAKWRAWYEVYWGEPFPA